MEKRSILIEIKSKYIIEKIFEYIKDKNFKFKLFIHSKLLLKKIDLDLSSYKIKYIERFYLNFNYFEIPENSNKDILRLNLKNDLIKYKIDTDILELYLSYYYNNKYKKENNKFNKYESIDIYSPFFDYFSQKEISKYFTILINMDFIVKHKLENDYIEAFNKLSKINSKYSAITFMFKNSCEIGYLNQIKIDFSKIKRLDIIKNDILSQKDENILFNDYYTFFETLFSFKGISNNLNILNISIYKLINYNSVTVEINTKLFSNINNFNSLIELRISKLKFNSIFILDIQNLKILSLEYIQNITFSKKLCFNLKKLYLNYTFIEKPNEILKFPELEELELNNLEQNYNTIIDFSSLKNIKIFTGDSYYFMLINNEFLEKIKLYNNINNSKNHEYKMITKIISFKTLKDIDIELNEIKDNELSLINDESFSIEKLSINWKNKNNDYILYNLQNKFPNLSYIRIYDYNIGKKNISEIKENKNFKIKNIYLYLQNLDVKFYCGSYELLKSIDLYLFYGRTNDLQNYFPLFRGNNTIIFKSLYYFSLHADEIKINVLENIYKNLDNLPNLKIFILQSYCKDVYKNFYSKFIEKLLLLNLDLVELDIKINDSYEIDEFYTEMELKYIYRETNIFKYNKFRIRKLFEDYL